MEKPGTQHGYQSTHYMGKLASTEPGQPTALTFNPALEMREQWQGQTSQTPFNPEFSVSSNFVIDPAVNLIKPILRRNCLHNGSNIVVQWKSFEIWVIKLEFAGTADNHQNKVTKRKILNPIYVPISELNYLLTLSERQIETRVVKSLKIGPNGTNFIYVPQEVAPSGEQADEDFSRKQSFGSPSKVASTSPKAVSRYEMSPNFSACQKKARLLDCEVSQAATLSSTA
jgi:hypothetical protein